MGTDTGWVPQGVPMVTDAGLVAQGLVVIMSDDCEKCCLLPFGVEHSSILKKWLGWDSDVLLAILCLV